jgi:DHA2 family multidrug resistance protein
MAQFNLQADFNTIIWPRIVLGVGMGFLFIPLTTLTMSGINKEEMANASAIYNLLRNLGGSFGVAFVTTITARGAQIHQAYLADNISRFDTAYQMAEESARQAISLSGGGILSEYTAQAYIYGQMIKQSMMIAFNDAFSMLSIFLVCMIPLALFMRKGRPNSSVEIH